MKKDTKKEIISPCEKCNNIERFSLKGCAKRCDKFFKHLKEVVFPNHTVPSPCENLRCGVPGVAIIDGIRIGCNVDCRLREIYHTSLGTGPGSNWNKTARP